MSVNTHYDNIASINLLPWRERERDERKRQFIIASSGCAIIIILIFVGLHLFLANNLRVQKLTNHYLDKEVTKIDKRLLVIKTLKNDKKNLLLRMRIIEELQHSRYLVVRLFDELTKVVPNGIYLTRLERNGHTLVVHGNAESNARVSELMRNIEKSKWFTAPLLTEIKTNKTAIMKTSAFKLQLSQIVQHTAKTKHVS